MATSFDYMKANLQPLLAAPSKDAVVGICKQAFLYGYKHEIPSFVVQNVISKLSINEAQCMTLLRSLCVLIKKAVFQGSTESIVISQIFPDDFHKNLRDLLIKIIIDNLNTWRMMSINNQVSLSKMVDFDWRVDIKTSSDSMSRMSVPTCLLQMKVQQNPIEEGIIPDESNINVELSKETLDTMLDGLSKIRDQLSAVAKH
ncbi:hypothetical protein ScPMuIL_015448 [Solemya velum]